MNARGFGSDNAATIHPDVLAAIARANVGHAPGYGHDDLTRMVKDRFGDHFGVEASAYLVFNGSGANVLSLRAACRPWEGVICAESAHLNVDEGGAPEAIAGVKLLTVAGGPRKAHSGAGRAADRADRRRARGAAARGLDLAVHRARHRLLAGGDPAIAALAHAHGLLLHVDGARLSNAAAALDVPLRALTTDAGVDIVSFGGTKNGLLGGEAVVVLNPRLDAGLPYLRKQSLQLASKMRFLAAQFEALLSDELWLRCAEQANAMAARLAGAVESLSGLEITQPVQSNAVFATAAAGCDRDAAAAVCVLRVGRATGRGPLDVLMGHDRGGRGHVRRGRRGRALIPPRAVGGRTAR